jgi:predicted Zn-dependent peptidase
MKHQITTLENGLRIVTAEMPGAQSATVAITAGVGSRYENHSTQGGVSHFLEHLFFKGTKNRPSTKIIAEQVDAVGGYNNAYTTDEQTCFYIRVPQGHNALALDILADMMTDSLFDPAEVDRERGTVVEEINMDEDNPASLVHSLAPQLLWPNHPLGHKVIGTKEVIQNISRDEIVDYMRKHYVPQNMVVTFAAAGIQLGSSNCSNPSVNC